jgi:hypothetical protein
VYSPTVAVITNVEADHLDHYVQPAGPSMAPFVAFCDRVVDGGLSWPAGTTPGSGGCSGRGGGAWPLGGVTVAPVTARARMSTSRVHDVVPGGGGPCEFG